MRTEFCRRWPFRGPCADLMADCSGIARAVLALSLSTGLRDGDCIVRSLSSLTSYIEYRCWLWVWADEVERRLENGAQLAGLRDPDGDRTVSLRRGSWPVRSGDG